MKVTFERIGRNHSVPPLTVTDTATADEVARAVWRYARPFLASRDVHVAVDLAQGRGVIMCGFHTGGEFTVEPTTTSYDTTPTPAPAT